MSIKIPVVNAQFSGLSENGSKSKAGQDSLIIQDEHSVTWLKKGSIKKELQYPGDVVICAELATFSGESEQSAVIVTSEFIYIYSGSGKSYVRSIPFGITRVFPFERGLIFERDITADQKGLSNAAKFFTMTDPILDLGLVVSSSASSLDRDEEMIAFGTGFESNLCVTRKPKTNEITIYHVRHLFLSKGRQIRGARRSSYKRRSTSLAAKHHEDSGTESDISALVERRLSFNLVENPITLDRMAAGEGVLESQDGTTAKLDVAGMRRDIVLTPIDRISCSPNSTIRPFCLQADDIQSVGLLDTFKKTLFFTFYKKAEGPVGLTQKVDTDSITAADATIISSNSKDESKSPILCILGLENQIFIYNPFLKLQSPIISVPDSWGSISKLMPLRGDLLSVCTDSGAHDLKILFNPSNELVSKCFSVLDHLLEPVSREYLRYLWISALSLTGTDELSALFSALLSCTIDFGPQFLDQDFPHDFMPSTIIKSAAWDACLDDPPIESELLRYLRHAHSLVNTEFGGQFDFCNVRQYIFICLHALREEYKLDRNESQEVSVLGKFLTLYAHLGKWSDAWKDHYEADIDISKIKCECNIIRCFQTKLITRCCM